MVLSHRESTQRCWIAGNAFRAEANHYQQQHNEMLQRSSSIYNDLNLFNPPANVNIVKPQPPIEPALTTRVSHLSSNGYYGFVHIHQETDGAIDSDITATENEASMDCTEEVPSSNTRKRGFEIEQPVYVNAAKKCKYEDNQMAADDDTMFDETGTESAAAVITPPVSELPTATFTDNSEFLNHHNEQLQNKRLSDEPFVDSQSTQSTLRTDEDVESLWWHTHGAVMHQMTNFVEF